MPGVPSGQGCDACRKQKKKCQQGSPRCTRCTRLNINCIGQGQRRFKFMTGHDRSNKTIKTANQSIAVAPRSSRVDVLVGSLISTIVTSVEIKYNLAWSWPFLEYLPVRLGRNEALDAATRSLVAAHSVYCARQEATPEVLVKYSKALRTLRICLDDVAVARSPETLGAVMLLLVCQALLGSSESRWTGHCEGAARLLRARGFGTTNDATKDVFERSLLMSLSASVLVEGVCNPNIDFSPLEWQSLIKRYFGTNNAASTLMLCLANVPDLLNRGSSPPDQDPDLIPEATLNFQTMQAMLEISRQNLADMEAILPSRAAPSIALMRAHGNTLRVHSFNLGLTIYLGRVLYALDPEISQDLTDQLEAYAVEMLELAQKAKIYAPLGSMFVPLSYCMAWFGVSTTDRQEVVRSRLFEIYSPDKTEEVTGTLQDKLDEFALLREFRRANTSSLVSSDSSLVGWWSNYS